MSLGKIELEMFKSNVALGYLSPFTYGLEKSVHNDNDMTWVMDIPNLLL